MSLVLGLGVGTGYQGSALWNLISDFEHGGNVEDDFGSKQIVGASSVASIITDPADGTNSCGSFLCEHEISGTVGKCDVQRTFTRVQMGQYYTTRFRMYLPSSSELNQLTSGDIYLYDVEQSDHPNSQSPGCRLVTRTNGRLAWNRSKLGLSTINAASGHGMVQDSWHTVIVETKAGGWVSVGSGGLDTGPGGDTDDAIGGSVKIWFDGTQIISALGATVLTTKVYTNVGAGSLTNTNPGFNQAQIGITANADAEAGGLTALAYIDDAEVRLGPHTG